MNEIADEIEKHVRAAFKKTGKVVYWPQELARFGTARQVTNALAVLRKDDKLDAFIRVSSEDGDHTCWEGSAEDFEKLKPFECQQERVHWQDLSNAAPYFTVSDTVKTSEENTGLPCVSCGRKQQRLNVEWIGDELHVRISLSIPRASVGKELKGMFRLLRMFIGG